LLLIRFKRWLKPSHLAVALMLAVSTGAFAQSAPSADEAVAGAQKVHASAQLAQLQVRLAKAEPTVVLGSGQFTAQYGQMNAADLDRYVSYEQPLGSVAQHVARGMRNAANVDWKEAEAEVQLRALERDVRLLHAAYEVARGRLAFAASVQRQLADDAARIRARVATGEWSGTEGISAQLALDQWSVTLTALENDVEQLASDLSTATGLTWPKGAQPVPVVTLALDGDTALHPALLTALNGARRTAQADVRLATATAWSPQWSVGGFRQQLEKVPGFQGVIVGVSVPLDPAAQARQRQARLTAEATEVETAYALRQLRHDFAAQRANAARWAERLPESSDWSTLDRLITGLSAQLREGEINFFEYRQAQSNAWSLAQAHFDAMLSAQSAVCQLQFYQSSHPTSL